MERTVRERRIAAPEQALTDLALPAARPRWPRPESRKRPRPRSLRNRDPRHDVPDLECAACGHARRARRRPPTTCSPAARASCTRWCRPRDDRRGNGGARTGGRRRRSVTDPRLDRPLDTHSLRRRSRRGRAREGRQARLPGLRAGADGAVGSTHSWQRLAQRRGDRKRYVHMERPRGLQVRHARPRLVCRGGPERCGAAVGGR